MATKFTGSRKSRVANGRLVVFAIFISMLGAAAESAGGSIGVFGLGVWAVALVAAGVGAWRIAGTRKTA